MVNHYSRLRLPFPRKRVLDMPKKSTVIKLFIFLLFAPVFFSLLVHLNEYRNPTAHGWGVSTDQQIFVGVNGAILKIENGALADTIYMRGDYALQVKESYIWVAGKGEDPLCFDTDGTRLQIWTRPDPEMYDKFLATPNELDTQNGTYRIRQTGLLSDHIEIDQLSDGAWTPLYRSSLIDTFRYGEQGMGKLLLCAIYEPCCIGVICILSFLTWRERKERKTREQVRRGKNTSE